MSKRSPLLISAAILAIAALACSQLAPAAPPQDPNAADISIVQTVAARQTEAALTNPPTATFTAPPAFSTLTLEPTLSVTPELTPTLETPLITVSVDTNCRTGPGQIFERVGMLLAGETAEIVGREPTGKYWFIPNPDESDVEYCWVWGEYATVTGNLLPLLYLSPAPPPLSSFSMTFVGVERCEKTWWVEFKLVNSSGAMFESISLTVRDSDTVTVTTMVSNDFPNRDGCPAPTTTASLVAGGALTVSSSAFGYNPAGNNLSARLKLCTEADQAGECVERELVFRP